MQVTHNKHELLEMIEQEGSRPLTPESIRNLHYLGGAYAALCRIDPDKADEEPMAHAPYTGPLEPVKPVAHA